MHALPQYGIIVWETADDKQLKIIKVRLNNILRIILSCNICTPVIDLVYVDH